ncbi:MAG: tRNA (guanosine(37)-N1)-methyltransferase TrmD [Legionellales bacterium]|nr:tRNA (guanosine(37)-N1)-methyltransferase TrmD [Legionellales bacterium]
MQISIITIFPELFDALHYGVLGRAISRELIKINHFNPRDYTADKYHRVDDRPYGGGPGMVMMAEPLAACIQDAKKKTGENAQVIYLSPQGKLFSQDVAQEMAIQQTSLILLCGRYEGIDERIIQHFIDQEWSIGDFILSGGEFAALVVIDAISRLVKGVLGREESAEQDSFSQGLLDHPHYTRPEQFCGYSVPAVLLSGNHAEILTWRKQEALKRTQEKRPDLIEKLQLTELECKFK